MRLRNLILTCLTLIGLSGCSTLEPPFRYLGYRNTAISPISRYRIPSDLGIDESIFTEASGKERLVSSIDRSLLALKSSKVADAYSTIHLPDFSPQSVEGSLRRFRELVLASSDATSLMHSVRQEFMFFRAKGSDRRGTMLFTGYCAPEVEASPIATAEYRYPLFKLPEAFQGWSGQHPTRIQLEGYEGTGEGMLRGYELAYLKDRFDVLFTQIQGSASLRFPNGQRAAVGFAGATNYPFRSVAAQLVRDGKIGMEQASADGLREYFRTHPQELNYYAAQNDRFVFFRALESGSPVGSIGVPVTDGRSFAADRSLMPPGALALVRADIDFTTRSPSDVAGMRGRFMLDQDTGSAIKGPGRVDLYFGSGTEACSRAGSVKHSGELYYLLKR